MGDAIHFGNRLANLIDTTALLVGGRSDFTHDVGDAGDGIDDIAHGFTGAFHQHRAHIDAANRVFNQAFDLFGCLRAAACQVTYLTGHHSKATALFTGTGSFYCRIQRQDVGLEGDTVDHAGNIGNLLRAASDVVHGLHHVGDHFAAFLRGF